MQPARDLAQKATQQQDRGASTLFALDLEMRSAFASTPPHGVYVARGEVELCTRPTLELPQLAELPGV